MRILYIGNFGPEHSTENDIRKSLESIGCLVFPIQEDKAKAENFAGYPWDHDLLLWTRTWPGIMGDMAPVLTEHRRRKIPTVAYHLDLYRGLARAKTHGPESGDPWWKCDFVFSPDGGDPAYWKEHGVNHVWSPPGVLESSCYLADPVPELAHDVVFVGSYNYHPEWPRHVLIDWLKATWGDRFVHYDHGSGMRGHRLNQLYASAKVIVGDSCFAGRAPGYWSDRIPETMGRGGILVHPFIHYTGYPEVRIEGIQYPLGYFAYRPWSLEELNWQIRALLAERDLPKTRKAAIEEVKQFHTYKVRMERMLRIIGGNKE